ncbi:MAG: Ig-like domain-containing protein [Idiomarina sp.]|nr:Ig-like domain-containing protein [Idiomarina sp.]
MKRIIVSLIIIFLTACNSSGSNPEIIGVNLTVSPTSIATGDSATLNASLVYDDDTTTSLNAANANFSINGDEVATLDGNQLTGISEGSVTVTMSYEGFTDTVSVTVGPVELRSLVLSDENVSLALGQSYTLEVYGKYSDNNVKLLEEASVEILDMDVLEFSNSSEATILESIAVGETEVLVTYEQLEAVLTVVVTDAEITRIVVGIDDARIAAGESTTLLARATLTDNTHQNVTADTVFSSNSDIVEITDNRVTGVVVGNAQIEGEHAGFTANVDIEVTPAVITELNIESSTTSLPLGTNATLHAQASYSDGDVRNVSSSADWTVNDSTVIELNSQGDMNAVGVGETSIAVTYQGYSDSISVEVTEAELVTITLNPASKFETFSGATFTATASGTYTDGSETDISSKVSWSSNDSGIASVSNHSDHPGRIEAKSEGVVTITASLNGEANEFELTVVEANLVDVEITNQPLNASNALIPQLMSVDSSGYMGNMSIQVNSSDLPAGRTVQLYAIGTFENSDVADVTSAVSWSIADTDIAQFTDPATEPGKVKGRIVGSTSVQVESGNGVMDSYRLDVSNAVIDRLVFGDGAGESLFVGEERQLIVRAEYSNGIKTDVSSDASWQSSDPAILYVMNEPSAKGRVKGQRLGDESITASLEGISVIESIATISPVSAVMCRQIFSECNDLSLPYLALGTKSISRIPAPAWFDIVDPITITVLGESVTVTSVSNSFPENCRVTGLEQGDTLNVGDEVEVKFQVARTFGQSEFCPLGIEFNGSNDIRLQVNYSITTN